MDNRSFERFAGIAALLAGACGVLYALAFVVLRDPSISAGFLLLGGFFTSAALVAVYGRVRAQDAGFALWALVLALFGAMGSAVHGGHDLSIALHPPSTLAVDLPNAVDPRGLMTFGFAGIALFIFSWQIARTGNMPRGLARLGYLSALLMMVLYAGRLTIQEANSPVILIPALLEGFIVNPAWYIWLGLVFLRTKK